MNALIQKRGLSIFALLSVLGVMGVFFVFTDTAPVGEVVEHLDPVFFLLCIFAVPTVDWLVAGFRMWMFSSVVCPRISYRVCVKNCAVGSFMGAATPSQTGGGVAQVYVLVREGANTGQALGILFMTFLSTLIFYMLVSGGVWGLAAAGKLPEIETSTPFAVAALLFVGVTLVCLLLAFFPQGGQAALRRMTNWMGVKKGITAWIERIAVALEDGSMTVQMLVRRHWLRFLLSVPVSVVLFTNKYIAAYLATRALGLHPPLMELIVIQVFLNIMLYFFPTPGGSGGAEVGTAMVMRSLVPSALLPAYTLLWRTATMYLSVLVGGSLFMRYIHRKPEPHHEGRQTWSVAAIDD